MSSRPQSASAAGREKEKLENYDLNGDQAAISPVRPASAPRAAGPSRTGENSNIDIFVRVRPVPKASTRLQVDQIENKVEFNLPRDAAQGYVNNQREHYEFRFNGVIGPDAKQDEVRPSKTLWR